ncbi:MAG: hypothetical protein HOO91_14305 [Bacteroidales bacterium]|nr:hypothetical protein [Bacteroidales bacterium]
MQKKNSEVAENPIKSRRNLYNISMDPCTELDQDLTIEIGAHSEIKKQIFIRFLLGLLNLDWLYDILITKIRGAEWTDILNALLNLDIAAAIWWLIKLLQEVGLKDLVPQLLKRIGPWALAIWVVTIVADIGILIYRLSRESDRYEQALKDLYNSSNCEMKDEIFKKHGLSIPK